LEAESEFGRASGIADYLDGLGPSEPEAGFSGKAHGGDRLGRQAQPMGDNGINCDRIAPDENRQCI
jgi:hypothetical protein